MKGKIQEKNETYENKGTLYDKVESRMQFFNEEQNELTEIWKK